MDHDQRFKTLIKEFFAEFLQLFFAAWFARLDSSRVEWLDKEVFPDPPHGDRRVLDLVAKVPTRQAVPGQRPIDPEYWLALVHIEIESPDKATSLRPRMFRAYTHLRNEHGLPVLPIGLFLRVGLEGIGIDVYEEHFWELCPLHFEYLYVGLPALDGVQYVQGNNWLGVALAALMKIPKDKAAWLGAEALRRLTEAPLKDQQRFLLGDCVQAYLPLDAEQQRQFDELLASPSYQGVQAMNATWYDKGIEKGMEKGMEKGKTEERQAILLALLEDHFGSLPAAVRERVVAWPPERLRETIKRVHRAKSLKELGLDD